jgi:thymidylate synthase (FAD)
MSNNIADYKNFVTPQTYLVGYTSINLDGLVSYLTDTNQKEFLEEITQAKSEGLSDGEILCSFYAKLCYASLCLGKNKNISKIRAIRDNILGTVESGHGSVFEHAQLNFLVRDASRIYTHEQVRHRVGAAYSQTSGRYVRNDVLNVVIDPILEPAYDLVEEARVYLEDWYKRLEDRLKISEEKSFARKKKLTSAMRRMLPNGQANELGFSLNLRSLRHLIELRTSEHAEWEIRLIYNQVYDLVKEKYPAILFDAQLKMVEGLNEITFKNKKI